MSKFINAIRVEMSDRRVAVNKPMDIEPITANTSMEELRLGYPTKVAVTVQVKYAISGVIYAKDITPFKENVVRQLQDTVYGEFKLELLKLERAVLQENLSEAFESICKIRREMGD